MKQFLIFGGKCFYGRGGFNDLLGHEDTLEKAESRITDLMKFHHPSDEKIEWWQIVDTATGDIVVESPDSPLGGSDDHGYWYNVKFSEGKLTHVNPDGWEEYYGRR